MELEPEVEWPPPLTTMGIWCCLANFRVVEMVEGEVTLTTARCCLDELVIEYWLVD
jgi:hypothetical protein